MPLKTTARVQDARVQELRTAIDRCGRLLHAPDVRLAETPGSDLPWQADGAGFSSPSRKTSLEACCALAVEVCAEIAKREADMSAARRQLEMLVQGIVLQDVI